MKNDWREEEKLRHLMQDSVNLHLRSDVPVGAYLSGGLDSSSIASLASQQTNKPLMAFTGAFGDGPEFDERPYARQVAGLLHTQHLEERVESAGLAGMERLIGYFD